jgi:hypothetical protein
MNALNTITNFMYMPFELATRRVVICGITTNPNEVELSSA